MISDERLAHLIYAADHGGLCNAAAVKYVHGGGSGQVALTCYELKQLLEPYLERRTATVNDAESLQDSASVTDKVSE